MARARKRTPCLLAAAGALLLAAALGACSSDEAVSDSPWAAEFEQARQQSVTDFQREVLRDDVITDEEYREVRQRYIDCLADAGIRATARPDGGYDFPMGLSEAQEPTELRCSEETTMRIEGLYLSTVINPRNEDFSALIAECLRTKGVVDESFTKEDWERFEKAVSDAFTAGWQELGGGDEYPRSEDLPRLPGGIRMDDPQVSACVNNPLGLPNSMGL